MPNYDFRCTECGHKFSVQVSMSDKDKVTCPGCSGKKVEQLFTGFMVSTGGASDIGCDFGCGMPGAGGGFGGG